MTTGALHIFKTSIDAPIDKVFHELTRTDALQPCFRNTRLVTAGLAPGEPLQWRFPSGRHVSAVGKVLAYEAPHRFGHSFNYARYDDAAFDIDYGLREAGSSTGVTVTLRNVPMSTASAADVIAGIRFMLRTLKRVAETGHAPWDARLKFWWIRRCESLLPARCRSEHWPLETERALPVLLDPWSDRGFLGGRAPSA